MQTLHRRALLAGTVAFATPAVAQPVPPQSITPAKDQDQIMSSGLSKARLARMHDIMAGHVASGRLPGLVTLLDRHGETHVDAIGVQSFGGGAPMRRDTIFRIASLTKPVTAAAAMILVEEAGCASTTRSTSSFPSSPTARCCARSKARSTTRCRRSARSRCAICSRSDPATAP